ncbi:hypothetical protein B0J12DRAFT_736845 [Macrophomina phaseolina]|uniref:Uncharacterized protein n=1 Tax=Macrophomina phaseolina TaxID=35725 RepID=A0ABQ8GLI0_9PEZI|nr:hypothetical protein B0J12DRAFT_736845 [Macrophomina phaseolina]
MTSLPCPLPQVDRALRPYIHDRHETLRIRKLLAHHVQSQIPRLHHQQGVESTLPIVPLTLAASPPSLLPELQPASPPPPPPELTGLRKKYWEAVQTHQLAKHRRDALHRELNELHRDSQLRHPANAVPVGTPDVPLAFLPPLPDGGNGHGITTYTSLLHQRRRHAELQILLHALDRIADTDPHPLQRGDLRQWVKAKLGDAPIPPPEVTGGGDAASATASEEQVKNHVLRLKKELLLAKQSLDAETDQETAAQRSLPADAVVSHSVEAQVLALRDARDELIAWIEGELAKMPEGDESLLSGTGATPQRQRDYAEKDATADFEVPVQEQVEALYDRYVDARAALIDAVDAATAVTKGLSTSSTLPSGPASQPVGSADAKTTEQKKLPPSAVLPFIPALLQFANDERALMQQTMYLRHRVAKAQEEARNTMQRLASESHMVPPDAESGIAWAHAARDAARASDEAVTTQIEDGQIRVRGAKEILAELDVRRERFAELKGEV